MKHIRLFETESEMNAFSSTIDVLAGNNENSKVLYIPATQQSKTVKVKGSAMGDVTVTSPYEVVVNYNTWTEIQVPNDSYLQIKGPCSEIRYDSEDAQNIPHTSGSLESMYKYVRYEGADLTDNCEIFITFVPPF